MTETERIIKALELLANSLRYSIHGDRDFAKDVLELAQLQIRALKNQQ